MKEIYLDNSATTQVDDRVIDYITKVMREHYGNPSSLYDLGLQSHLLMEEAAKSAAALIGGKGENLYFTSGYVFPQDKSIRTFSFSVRCVRDK